MSEQQKASERLNEDRKRLLAMKARRKGNNLSVDLILRQYWNDEWNRED